MIVCFNLMLEINYNNLTPDLVINAVESLGYLSDACIFPLNSYENRVYQIGIEDQPPLIAKFYRPYRWTDDEILEEHQYTQMLEELEIPVVAPIVCSEQKTLHQFQGYRFSVYPRKTGQPPEPDDFDQLYRLGVLIGRIHQAGAAKNFSHRPTISVDDYARKPAQFLVENDFIPRQFRSDFEQLIVILSDKIDEKFASITHLKLIRTHGDCHIGNILWNRTTGPWFVDFDDCRMAPAIQDLWMLLSDDPQHQTRQLSELIEGYREFADFSNVELQLIESLRVLRIIHYSSWLAMRWNDSTFPLNFPWFNTDYYWEQFVTDLHNLNRQLDLPALRLF